MSSLILILDIFFKLKMRYREEENVFESSFIYSYSYNSRENKDDEHPTTTTEANNDNDIVTDLKNSNYFQNKTDNINATKHIFGNATNYTATNAINSFLDNNNTNLLFDIGGIGSNVTAKSNNNNYVGTNDNNEPLFSMFEDIVIDNMTDAKIDDGTYYHNETIASFPIGGNKVSICSNAANDETSLSPFARIIGGLSLACIAIIATYILRAKLNSPML